MFLNDFSIVIPQGTEDNGYVLLPHGKVYTLRLRNRRSVEADACVEIDGKNLGTWRLDPGESLELERPAEDTGMFTFYRSGTGEAGQVGEASIAREDKGLVKVSFLPDKRPPSFNKTLSAGGTQSRGVSPDVHLYSSQISTNYGSPEMSASAQSEGSSSMNFMHDVQSSTLDSMTPPAGAEAGVTGLSGQSSQVFGTVGPLRDPDYSQMTIIQFRLIEGKSDPRELKPATNSTAYPPPIS